MRLLLVGGGGHRMTCWYFPLPRPSDQDRNRGRKCRESVISRPKGASNKNLSLLIQLPQRVFTQRMQRFSTRRAYGRHRDLPTRGTGQGRRSIDRTQRRRTEAVGGLTGAVARCSRCSGVLMKLVDVDRSSQRSVYRGPDFRSAGIVRLPTGSADRHRSVVGPGVGGQQCRPEWVGALASGICLLMMNCSRNPPIRCSLG